VSAGFTALRAAGTCRRSTLTGPRFAGLFSCDHGEAKWALGRKNHLFAGSDYGGEHWAVLASLIETCKMNGVDPQAYLRDVLAKIVARHPMSRIDELLPFAYRPAQAENEAA